MQIKLKKKPKGCIIVEGFPGSGLIGTVTTEFLLNHLECEMIGKIENQDAPGMIAIHENKLVEPIGLFYNKKYNIVIVHAITALTGFEWPLAQAMTELATLLEAKEIVSIEGVGTDQKTEESRVFFYASEEDSTKKLKKSGLSPLKEGIIIGVTACLLLKNENVLITCLFAETHSNLPDSNASAQVVKALDAYLKLQVDYQPLVKQAEQFEAKIKQLISKGNEAQEMSDKKRLSYVG